MLRAFLILMLALMTVTVSPLQAQTVAAGAAAAAAPDYRLGAADKIKITVFNEPTLSGDFLVNSDGSVAVPLIGNVPALGRSAVELQKAIEQKFGEGYLKEPRVVVEVLTYRPFYIYGEVTKPGEYPYSSGLSVLKAVALAQGFTYRADQRKIFLKRSAAGGKEIRVTADELIQPGDTIRIAERFF
jgi:protein involved in polysaccharide export with SLBB domain